MPRILDGRHRSPNVRSRTPRSPDKMRQSAKPGRANYPRPVPARTDGDREDSQTPRSRLLPDNADRSGLPVHASCRKAAVIERWFPDSRVPGIDTRTRRPPYSLLLGVPPASARCAPAPSSMHVVRRISSKSKWLPEAARWRGIKQEIGASSSPPYVIWQRSPIASPSRVVYLPAAAPPMRAAPVARRDPLQSYERHVTVKVVIQVRGYPPNVSNDRRITRRRTVSPLNRTSRCCQTTGTQSLRGRVGEREPAAAPVRVAVRRCGGECAPHHPSKWAPAN
jgi:hypothetical protein